MYSYVFTETDCFCHKINKSIWGMIVIHTITYFVQTYRDKLAVSRLKPNEMNKCLWLMSEGQLFVAYLFTSIRSHYNVVNIILKVYKMSASLKKEWLCCRSWFCFALSWRGREFGFQSTRSAKCFQICIWDKHIIFTVKVRVYCYWTK